MSNPLKKQVGGDHYKKLKIQPVEYIVANEIPFREASVIKYVTRWKDKDGYADIRKSIHFLEMILAEEQNQETKETPNTALNSLPEGYRFMSQGEALSSGCLYWAPLDKIWCRVPKCCYGIQQDGKTTYICPIDAD